MIGTTLDHPGRVRTRLPGSCSARSKGRRTTIRRRLKVLERSLGTRLFDRTAQGLIPTEADDAVRMAAKRAEEAVLSVRGRLLGRDTRPSGSAFGGFHQSYPEIRLELLSGYIAIDIARGRRISRCVRFRQ